MNETGEDYPVRKTPFAPRLMVEPGEVRDITDIVVIRQPSRVPIGQFNEFGMKLAGMGFLPVVIPSHPLPVNDDDGNERYFPTDSYREVGDIVFDNSLVGDLRKIGQVVRANPTLFSRFEDVSVRVNDVPLEFRGGDFVTSPIRVNGSKLMVFSQEKFFPKMKHAGSASLQASFNRRNEGVSKGLSFLTEAGWRVVPVSTRGMSLASIWHRRTSVDQDLDFLLSLFAGNDGKVHGICAESMRKRLAVLDDAVMLHTITDKEALQAGCNIADCRGGRVLVHPHRDNCPTTYAILRGNASPEVSLIEAPLNFLDGGGGPRCAISSISI